MLRNVTFSDVDTTDEIAKEMNKIIGEVNINAMENKDKILQLDAKIKRKAEQSWVKKLLAPKTKEPKKKGSVLVKILLSLVILILLGSVCFGQEQWPITYDTCSTPQQLYLLLTNRFANMTSNSYLFTPTATAPTASEGRVYYDSDDNALLLYNGTTWQTIDAAGGMTLNSAYDFGGAGSGKTITATDGAVTIQNTEADSASLLSLSYTTGAQTGDAITITISGGTADGIEFENTGSGYDMEGTGAVWFMDKSGNLTCVDITTSDDVLLAGTNYDVAFDASRDALVFEDEAILGFGAGTHDDAPDMTFIFDASGSDLNITFDDLEIAFGSDGAGGDVYFYFETASHNVLFSEANDEVYFTHVDIQMDDNADLIMGSGNDFVIESDTADTLEILTKLTDGTATINLGVDGAGADLKMFPETAGDFVLFDSSADEMYFEDCDLKINEGGQIEFCASDNATDWTIDLATAERLTFTPTETTDDQSINLGDATNTTDLAIFGATASTVLFDASGDEVIFNAYDISLQDGDFLKFGDGDDFTMDSSTAKNLDIAPAANSDDYILNIGLDQSGVSVKMFGASASHLVHWDAANDIFYHGADAEGHDVKWFGDTASSYMLWDENLFTNGALVFSAADIQLLDGDGLFFGSAAGTGDFKISDESDVLTIDVVAAGVGSIAIGNDADDVPLKWFGETTNCYFQLTGDQLQVEGSTIALGDGDAILLGDALGTGDFTISSTSAVLTIAQVAADTGTIVIGADDTDVPITWNGEAAGADMILTGDTILFDGIDMTFEDTDLLKFGDAGADGTITSDGTNIDFTITAAMTLGDGGTSNYMSIAADGEITLTGTAKVTKNHQLPIMTGGGTVTVSAITGAPSIDFNADGEIVYVSFQVPNDWDAASDMTIVAMIKNEIAETDGDDIEIICTVKGIADGEAHTDAGQTVTMALDLTGGDEGQNYVNKVTGTIDYNEASHPIAAGDTVIIKGVISLGTGTECTGPLHIVDWWIEYTASKLGTAT